jgi:hypothetical protein
MAAVVADAAALAPLVTHPAGADQVTTSVARIGVASG